VPEAFANVDREKVKTRDVRAMDVFQTLQGSPSSHYVNDFNSFGRT